MFGSKDNAPEPKATPTMKQQVTDMHRGGTTQIAPGAEVSGQLKTSGSIVVEGRIEGTVKADGDIQIGAKGSVDAEIEGQNVTVAGKVTGRIFADGKVILVSGSSKPTS